MTGNIYISTFYFFISSVSEILPDSAIARLVWIVCDGIVLVVANVRSAKKQLLMTHRYHVTIHQHLLSSRRRYVVDLGRSTLAILYRSDQYDTPTVGTKSPGSAPRECMCL